ncbi:HAD family hydrolase [Herbaspirillum sp. RTI4]|uniref:histidinol-phosphatase n=1 Tax=Herbaspirillum sp. RTI4 TaxID=3048640 RepID=UPI002AB44F76|nr:HAD family hydrolase [Herbaspirillum sp. RTI4]MDY7576843.1 HAD family hydrolase [Herbaspirillum sp. RTI4]MEA9983356.1 HAD family hydrolase [Herbaspirillum sp. RTI4]
MNLALFDLDHTLLPLDSDHEWGQFLSRTGAVDPDEFRKHNNEWYAQYEAGTLDPVKYLEFAFSTLARFPRAQLDTWHAQFLREVVQPVVLPVALALVKKHQEAGDLVAIVTATNSFVTAPIARLFDVEHLVAAHPVLNADGSLTGQLANGHSYGAGKIVQTEAWLAGMQKTLGDFERSYFYSDSQNDIPLMSLVTDPVATNPNAKLKAHALAHAWPILNLFEAHLQ